MSDIPREHRGDSTIALLKDPYKFISKRCRELHSDVFVTRILLKRTICMSGAEAARLFYDPSRFIRHGAPPLRLQQSLFGKGGVQALDDEAHQRRKALFLSLLSQERIGDVVATVTKRLREYAGKWASMDRVVLYPELQEVLTRAVCAWAGVPLDEDEVGKRARQLAFLFDGAGAVGPRHWRSRIARQQTDRWIAAIIDRIRSGDYRPPHDSAAFQLAWYREPNGGVLPSKTAAVEVLNILRPTVAVSVYIVFLAHALHEHPRYRDALRRGDPIQTEAFVQEVRRFYPFFPATTALVRREFDWNGLHFPADVRVLLDLHGINHDARVWDAPEEFRPERFLHWDGDAFTFVPQGGGDHQKNHRCPGEWATIEIMKAALDFLVNGIRYEVPPQDLELDDRRLPALPRSRFVITKVSRVARFH
jgi:fatty-acid peroxygenase